MRDHVFHHPPHTPLVSGERPDGVSHSGHGQEAGPREQTTGRRTCAQCGATDRTVLIGMAPGRDGKPWSLCRGCWSNGVAEPITATEATPDVVVELQAAAAELPGLEVRR
jgi:hypothetical protein